MVQPLHLCTRVIHERVLQGVWCFKLFKVQLDQVRLWFGVPILCGVCWWRAQTEILHECLNHERVWSFASLNSPRAAHASDVLQISTVDLVLTPAKLIFPL